MCGITGFFDTKLRLQAAEIQQIGQAMVRAVIHRGPDDQGLWQDPDMPLLLGQRRLSIIDLSPEGHQPMESHSGRYVVTYNGEIYNFQELQAELEQAGVKFRGRSDTEIMLAAVDQWGLNRALQKLNGMFAIALWDKREKQLHLIRDRLGKKPLYFGWAGTCFVFGSELKSLCAHPDFKTGINRNVLALYMRYGYVPPPHCIYDGIWQLPAGCRVTLRVNDITAGEQLTPLIEPYWHHPQIVEEARRKDMPDTDDQALSGFENLLENAVRQRMISDVPLGAFLSGGIDSSAVVALMQKLSSRPVKTFSIGFDADGYNEAPYAQNIADHLGTEHHELYVQPRDALAVIPKLPDMYDEPFADVSQIPTYLVSKFAREHVTVALSGDGGDELLGGYVRHSVVPALWKRIGWMPLFARKAMRGGIHKLSVERWNKLVPQHPQFGERLYKAAELLPMASPEDVYMDLISQWKSPETLVLNSTEPLDYLRDPAWQPKGLSFAERMIYGDMLSYLPNDVLTKVDRASMAVSLEARAPLLDKNLFEYVWGLPQHMKIRGGQGKWLLRQLLHKYVPQSLFDRPKQGFAVPVGKWLRGPLQDWAEDLLDEQKIKEQGFLDPAMIRQSWDMHQQGKGREEHKLWTVLMFQSWLEKWG